MRCPLCKEEQGQLQITGSRRSSATALAFCVRSKVVRSTDSRSMMASVWTRSSRSGYSVSASKRLLASSGISTHGLEALFDHHWFALLPPSLAAAV